MVDAVVPGLKSIIVGFDSSSITSALDSV